jgi:hypothetical protein
VVIRANAVDSEADCKPRRGRNQVVLHRRQRVVSDALPGSPRHGEPAIFKANRFHSGLRIVASKVAALPNRDKKLQCRLMLVG